MVPKFVSRGLILSLVAACVSQTVPEWRFNQSRQLAGPTFSVTLADPANYTFAAVGDLHVSQGDTVRLGHILDGADAAGDAFLVLLGDVANEGEKSDFQAVQDLLQARGWADRTLYAIGNHDVFGKGWDNYREVVGPSYYAMDVGTTRFISVDTADGVVGQSQMGWLREQLARGGMERVFILSHYVPVVPGQETYLKLANATQALELMDMASDAGITGWLGGHYHSYVLGNVKGVDYLVAGGGGGRRMGPVRDYFYVQVRVSSSGVTYQMNPVP